MTGPVLVDTNVFAYRKYAWISRHLATAVDEDVRVRIGNRHLKL